MCRKVSPSESLENTQPTYENTIMDTRQLSSLSIWNDICHVWMKMYENKKGKNSYIFCCCFPFCEWFFQLFRSEKVRCESSRYSFVKHKLCCVLSDRITGTIYALALEYFGKSIFLRVLSFLCFMLVGKHGKIIRFMRQKNFPKQGILCIFGFFLSFSFNSFRFFFAVFLFMCADKNCYQITP